MSLFSIIYPLLPSSEQWDVPFLCQQRHGLEQKNTLEHLHEKKKTAEKHLNEKHLNEINAEYTRVISLADRKKKRGKKKKTQQPTLCTNQTLCSLAPLTRKHFP